MARKVGLFTAQFGDLPLKAVCETAARLGFDGLEVTCCSEHHFRLDQLSQAYCDEIKSLVESHNLKILALSNHLVGQCVCDRLDERHKAIVPAYIWGDGEPEGIHQRAAEEMIKTGQAASMLGLKTVVGFTGSPIWHLLYSFPPVPPSAIEAGYEEFARRFTPILDAYQAMGIRFALEIHPTEIAFDIVSAERALQAVNYHPAFGFNFDPSHFGYQGVDYVKFIDKFSDRIFHVHMKDVWWSDKPTEAGVFGGHTNFCDPRRYWDFRSLGRGKIQFEEIIRALNRVHYTGPLSVEWEDGCMDRVQGAGESCRYVKQIDFVPSDIAFDSAFTDR